MDSFAQDQGARTLRGYRALLGVARPVGCAFYFPAAFSVAMAVGVFVAVCVDWADYARHAHATASADKAPWPAYGGNLAMLLCLAYFAARANLFRYCGRPCDNLIGEPEPLPRFGWVVWLLFVVANPAMLTTICLYNYEKKLTGFRDEQEGAYAFTVSAMMLNMIVLSNTPLMLTHLWAWVLALAAYLGCLGAYEHATGLTVYPFASSAQPIAVFCVGVLVYLLQALILGVRDKLVNPMVWTQKMQAPHTHTSHMKRQGDPFVELDAACEELKEVMLFQDLKAANERLLAAKVAFRRAENVRPAARRPR